MQIRDIKNIHKNDTEKVLKLKGQAFNYSFAFCATQFIVFQFNSGYQINASNTRLGA